ncbi:hypothetical protein X798_05071, partial [Onchocerca flexuosa]
QIYFGSLTLGTPLAAKKTTVVREEEAQEDEINVYYDGEVTHIDENETQLLRQVFMLNLHRQFVSTLLDMELVLLIFTH